MKRLTGTYAGTVENVQDPEKRGRVKVRVPAVYGIVGDSLESVPVNDLPWAIPSGLPAGGGSLSGGFDWLPVRGDQVFVRFLDGEPEKPIWEWAMQSRPQRQNLPLNNYDDNTKEPLRGALTRFNHTIEFTEGNVILTTAQGYNINIREASAGQLDGSINLSTPKANFMEISDEDDNGTFFLNNDLYLQILNQFYSQSASLSFRTTIEEMEFISGTSFDVTTGTAINLTSAGNTVLSASGSIDATGTAGVTLTTPANMQLNYATLLLGAGATQPLVLGASLTSLLNTLIVYLDTHTHGNGNNGSPTSPPIVPSTATLASPLTTILSTTAFTR